LPQATRSGRYCRSAHSRTCLPGAAKAGLHLVHDQQRVVLGDAKGLQLAGVLRGQESPAPRPGRTRSSPRRPDEGLTPLLRPRRPGTGQRRCPGFYTRQGKGTCTKLGSSSAPSQAFWPGSPPASWAPMVRPWKALQKPTNTFFSGPCFFAP
jgi:hypothetical protein